MSSYPFTISIEQSVLAWITLFLTIAVLITSIVNMYFKKQIANSRGQTLVYLTMFMHLVSIFLPNIFTIICYHKINNHFMLFGWVMLTLDNYATIIITNLILMRAVFMFWKSKDRNIVHLRGFLLTQILYITSIFWFIQVTKSYLYPLSTYQSYYYFKSVTYFSVFDSKNVIILGVFLVCVVVVTGLSQWGAYQEMVSLMVLQLLHMCALGLARTVTNHNTSLNAYFFSLEIISNAYRILLMVMNCFFFIWFFDGVKADTKNSSDIDPYKASGWNQIIKKYFKKFLKFHKREEELEFFRNNMENNENVWYYFKNKQGKFPDLRTMDKSIECKESV